MKKFLLRLGLFLVGYLVMINCAKYIFPPSFSWGNEYFSQKREDYAKAGNINTLFIGSSRIYRQVNPAIFDSIVNASHPAQPVHSFNFGSPATFAPETYLYCEELINRTNGLQNVFLELNSIPELTDNIFSIRGSAWLDSRQALFVGGELLHSNDRPNRLSELRYLTAAYLQNMLTVRNLGYVRKKVGFASGPHGDGYYSLDSQFVQHYSAESFKEHTAFVKDSTVVRNRAEKISHDLAAYTEEAQPDPHLQRLLALYELCKSKNIRLFFIVTPRMLDNRVLDMARRLPASSVLDYSDPARYPEFYAVANSFDHGHLNNKGATLFTAKLATVFLQQH